MDIERFRKLPVLGIVRSPRDFDVEGLIGACASEGLEAIEIAMNSAGAARLIARAVKASGGRMTVGAGTVLDTDTMKLALDAGATFIVMPALIPDVMGLCVKRAIPAFPGALTPREVLDAWRAGATMVKVFPSSVFGPSYIRELKGPFDRIELLACGGIRPDNIREYFACGAGAVAFGSGIFSPDLLERRQFDTIRRSLKELLDNAR
jgi:2-dehydro-3-deoxyphosphogluconate aldolase/(4S)-4-hydroxy-2-oxoglutarate aldolase